MKIRILFQFILFVLSPCISVYIIELFIRGNRETTNLWISENQDIFLISITVLFLIQCFLLSILNNVYLAILLTNAFWLILLQVNKYKIQMIEEPLLPWDLFFINQILDLLPELYKSLNIGVTIIGVVIIGLLIIILIKYTRFNIFNWQIRAGLFASTILSFVLLANYPNNFLNKYVNDLNLELMSWDQKANQEANGFIVGFILNMPSVIIDEPSTYSERSVDKHVNLIDKNNDYEISNEKPNIIIIMSEAFWEISNLNLSNNLLSVNPTVEENKKGYVISPSYGGGTANVEFEVLTGFSMNNLPGGSIPYQQYIVDNQPSLATILSKQGYKTSAIHTFYKYFWNREKVYNYLGFEKFTALDDMVEPKYFGEYYVDDIEINDLILDEITGNKEPTFIYAVTMQNHAPFLNTRYGDDTLEITESYSPDTNQIINTYGTGILHSDQVLSYLMEDLEKTKEPTLLVFFGDHLPMFGNVYSEVGYVGDMENKTLEEELKMKKTPLVVWNNYDKEIDYIDSISASFLAPKVMEWAELEAPRYYNFLNIFSEEIPGYTSLIKLDKNGALYFKTPKHIEELEESYKMIQYDMLFGKEYSKKLLFE